MSWFEELFGFAELSYDATREQFYMDDDWLVVKSTGKRFHVGPWECLSPKQMHQRLAMAKESTSKSGAPAPQDHIGLRFQHILGEAAALHHDADNANAVFQVASQFNALEMTSPTITPEQGITRYARDRTQGPACALSCPAATVFRNYYCMPGGVGQGDKDGAGQLDLLSGVAALVDNPKHGYWRMRNGYCLPTDAALLAALSQRLEQEAGLADAVRDEVAVGIHWSTEVQGAQHQVCQVFTSALPIAYCNIGVPLHDWKPFATAVLDGLYDAVLAAAAIVAAARGTRVKVHLTQAGAGVFGNPSNWVAAAIQRAMQRHASEPLDVKLVHYDNLPNCAPWTTLAGPEA